MLIVKGYRKFLQDLQFLISCLYAPINRREEVDLRIELLINLVEVEDRKLVSLVSEAHCHELVIGGVDVRVI